MHPLLSEVMAQERHSELLHEAHASHLARSAGARRLVSSPRFRRALGRALISVGHRLVAS